MENKQKNDIIWLMCDCYGHALHVEHYDEGGLDKGFYISLFERGIHGKQLCWRERFRWIWNLLRTGCIYTDMVILDYNRAKELSDHINYNITYNKMKELRHTLPPPPPNRSVNELHLPV